ncbi:MAG TPA: fumarylacetoacetate hydrolase family protein [Gammaproteobacteria bacterium]|nr:fumarylacetoacetate hydrolase family protein [Gammaproteobacteria bacterium]
MKLTRFRRPGGASFGIVLGDGVADLGRRFPSLSWEEALDPERLDALAAAARGADYALDEVEFAVPIGPAAKVLCIGRNYGKYHEVKAEGRPKWPSVFARFVSSFAAHGEAIVRPAVSEQLDYEGELCAVIGRRARHLREDRALLHVAGYTVMNEGSVRDWQRYGSQNCPGKNFWRSGAVGPWVATRDEIADPGALTIETRVDGETRQRGETREMLFSLAEILCHVSRFTWLEPGDIVATGSPGGSAVDEAAPRWLSPGQTIEVEIRPIGVLRNPVVAE